MFQLDISRYYNICAYLTQTVMCVIFITLQLCSSSKFAYSIFFKTAWPVETKLQMTVHWISSRMFMSFISQKGKTQTRVCLFVLLWIAFFCNHFIYILKLYLSGISTYFACRLPLARYKGGMDYKQDQHPNYLFGNSILQVE